jgi:hypothetical protein
MERGQLPPPKDAIESPPASPEVDIALDRIAAAGSDGLPPAEYAALLQSLAPQRPLHEQRLTEILASADDPRVPAATRLLADLAGARSLDALRKLLESPTARQAAIGGLARLEDPAVVAWHVRQERAADARVAWLAGLVERPDSDSVATVVELLRDPIHAEATLVALAAASRPPVETYFSLLTSPDADVRAMAALALGRINGPMVTRRLIELVDGGTYRQEALLALVTSEGAEAQLYVAHAGRDEQLATLVRLAERRRYEVFSRRAIP